MTFKEIFELVLTKVGHFVIPPDKLELNPDRFRILVNNTLNTYNRWCPRSVHLWKNLMSSRRYTFTEDNTPEGIPDQIVEVIPARVSGMRPFMLRDEYAMNPELDIKQEFPFVYRKPVLTTIVNADYDILALYKHRVTEVSGTVENRYEFEITTLDPDADDAFFDLLSARFLKALGKSRRAFTIQNLQITSDAAELISDAMSMEETALSDIQENKHKFYLAWG